MIHELVLKETIRDTSTGLISDLKFDIITSIDTENKWDTAWVGKYSISTPGSIDDPGFIAYNSLTSDDLLGFINKYGDPSDNTNGLAYHKTLNSASFAANIESNQITKDLPPNINISGDDNTSSDPITI